MICNKCNHELPDDSKFCQYCGSKLETGFVISGEALNELSEENADIQTNIKEKDLVEEVNEDMTQEEAFAFVIKTQAEETKKVMSQNLENQPNYENEEDFGLIPQKPIYTFAPDSVIGEEEYLQKLRTTNGEKIKWKRRGCVGADGVNGLIDVYDTFLPSGEFYKKIYINMYGARASKGVPKGFIFAEKKKNFIRNLLETKKKDESNDQKQDSSESPVSRIVGPVNVTALLKRGFLALEDGEWKRADEFFEQCLNENAELAEAYLGKLMAELHVKTQEELSEQQKTFDSSSNYQRVLRFGDEAIKEFIIESNELVKERIFEESYKAALNLMERAKTKEDFLLASEAFAKIGKYKNALVLADKCKEKAENVEKDILYRKAQRLALLNYSEDVEEARKIFVTLGDWKDSKKASYACVEKFKKLRVEEKKGKKTGIVLAILVFSLLILLILFVIKQSIAVQDDKYYKAINLMNSGNFSEAISEFEKLNGYKDSENQINVCYMSILDAKYNQAISLMNAGKIVEAYELLISLDEYKDSAEKAESIYTKYTLKKVKAGEYINFGTYEQDNNTDNGKEDIQWLVLEVKDNKVFVVSKYVLDVKQYHKYDADITWETCTLRNWLNNDFLNSTFSNEEKEIISITTVYNNLPDWYDTNPGRNTKDRIFLLSTTEAEKYWDSFYDRRVSFTQYARKQQESFWDDVWLRSTGCNIQSFAGTISGGGWESTGGAGIIQILDGQINSSGKLAYQYCGVRPAMWIDISGIE